MSDSVWPHRWQPPGSPIPGILQARTLEWVAISFSNAWKWKVKGKSLSRVQLFATPWTAAYQAPPSMGFSRQEYWSGVPLPSLDPMLRDRIKKILKRKVFINHSISFWVKSLKTDDHVTLVFYRVMFFLEIYWHWNISKYIYLWRLIHNIFTKVNYFKTN